MPNQNERRRRGTGLAIHATTAAFTTARAATSHLRRRYRETYLGRYRYAWLVFGFDMSLLGLAAFLAILNIYLFTVLPAPIGDLRLVFKAPAIYTAEPIALDAVVSSVASSTRTGVKLQWQLPAGTEILEAVPPLDASGHALIGDLKPGQSADSRLVVRLFSPGDTARFDFTVSDARGSVSGHETRQIMGSGLQFEPVVKAASLAPQAAIAYRFKNTTAQTVPHVVLSASGATLDGSGRLELGDVPAYAERIVFVQPDSLATMRLGISAKDATLVDLSGGPAILTTDPTGATLSLKPSSGSHAAFTVDAKRDVSIAVFHPGLPEVDNHERIFTLPAGHHDISVPVQAPTDSSGEWFAVPYVILDDGNALGNPVRAPLVTAFGLNIAARYYASTGDQLGVGPLPPRVGQSTKYWIRLALSPTTSDLANVSVRIHLGKNVHVTGRDALPDGGSFAETNGDFVWSAPYVPANGQGISASFEVELIPDGSQKGTVPDLVTSAEATATDQPTSSVLETSASGVNANLPDDELGKNKGTVQ
jgi:hypothetical protein